jgi:hypothetical protein
MLTHKGEERRRGEAALIHTSSVEKDAHVGQSCSSTRGDYKFSERLIEFLQF